MQYGNEANFNKKKKAKCTSVVFYLSQRKMLFLFCFNHLFLLWTTFTLIHIFWDIPDGIAFFNRDFGCFLFVSEWGGLVTYNFSSFLEKFNGIIWPSFPPIQKYLNQHVVRCYVKFRQFSGDFWELKLLLRRKKKNGWEVAKFLKLRNNEDLMKF